MAIWAFELLQSAKPHQFCPGLFPEPWAAGSGGQGPIGSKSSFGSWETDHPESVIRHGETFPDDECLSPHSVDSKPTSKRDIDCALVSEVTFLAVY